ncbi:MAG: TRAM domain-containing protein [Anaerolineales bacterium]|nr:TRAM domain-containing protein [Anaerolineales bacterium]
MRADSISRLIGLIGFAFGGFFLEERAPRLVYELLTPELRLWLFPVLGGLLGVVLAPYLSTRPARTLRKIIGQSSTQVLLAGLMGLVTGLLVAALLAWPLSTLPQPLNQVFPSAGAILCGWLGITFFVARRVEIMGTLHLRSRGTAQETGTPEQNGRGVLLDTSVIIDGRVSDISKAGFLDGPIMVPHFVLNELQHIADSSDATRRSRGRRGLEILNKLQKESNVPVKVTNVDVDGVPEVDDKLVSLAKQLHCPVVTNDFNLNRVAKIQGVTVLNINELANAVKVVCLPGEQMEVEIIQDGKEEGQGVGYLEDGTMVVVDNGHRRMNSKINVVVTKVLQTSAGRMLFARLDETYR